MADKRSTPTEFERLGVLGLVLYSVAMYGEKLFQDEEERRLAAECLAMAFSAEEFGFWRRAAVPQKPSLEALALVNALRSLVVRQFRRQIRSGTIKEDLVPYFKELYRGELRKCLPDSEGVTEGRQAPALLPTQPSVDDSPEEGALGSSTPASGGGIPELIDQLSGGGRKDPHSLEEANRLLGMGSGIFLMHSLRAGLTSAESEAVRAVLHALVKGASWHSTRKDSLSDVLSKAQQRSWRRACAKLPCLKVWYLYRDCSEAQCVDPELRPFCEMHARLRQAAALDKKQQAARGEQGRYRGGNVLLTMADKQREAGRPDIAAGIRAVDRSRRGEPLSEQEIMLAKGAQQWGNKEWKPALLRANPLLTLMAPLREDRPVAAGREFALECLRLALLCWPEGGAPARDTPANPTSG